MKKSLTALLAAVFCMLMPVSSMAHHLASGVYSGSIVCRKSGYTMPLKFEVADQPDGSHGIATRSGIAPGSWHIYISDYSDRWDNTKPPPTDTVRVSYGNDGFITRTKAPKSVPFNVHFLMAFEFKKNGGNLDGFADRMDCNEVRLTQSASYGPLPKNPSSTDLICRDTSPSSVPYIEDSTIVEEAKRDKSIKTIARYTPVGARAYTAPNGTRFLVPPKADFAEVYRAGKSGGRDIGAARKAIGHFGKFDFQRDGDTFYGVYTDASNYAVGVYMNGAGFTLTEMSAVGWVYNQLFSSAPSVPQLEKWKLGWGDAENGDLSDKCLK